MNISKKLKKILFLSASTLVVCLVLLFLLRQQNNDHLIVSFFDVGQGDSIFIQTPAGHDILIDGGPDVSVLDKLGRSMPYYDHTIDMIILTHPHADHIIGMLEVLERYQVKTIVHSNPQYDSAEYDSWFDALGQENARVIEGMAGQKFNFGEVSLEILFPLENVSGQEFENINDSSVIVRLDYLETSFLFTGDASVEVEEELVEYYQNDELDVDILKVGHHGSKYSSSQEFVNVVSPEYGVIQVGEGNKFDHPHELALRRLKAGGVELLRNDELGDIVIEISENVISINKNL